MAFRKTYSIKEYQNMANLATEFYYDANGNMITDLDREIVTIKYNLLNLPELIQFKNGCQIKNTYSADGQKLSSRYVTVNAGVYHMATLLSISTTVTITIGKTIWAMCAKYGALRIRCITWMVVAGDRKFFLRRRCNGHNITPVDYHGKPIAVIFRGAAL